MGSPSNQFKNRNFKQALMAAVNGILVAFKTERNLKIDLVIFGGLWLIILTMKFQLLEIIICNLNWVLIISGELINTVIERLLDKLCGVQYDPDVKMMKDIAAGAVFVLAVALVVNVGLIVLKKFIF